MALLLVTNDDGVHAAGLAALASALADLGEVHVLAPEREQSARGHALTLHRPLRVQRRAPDPGGRQEAPARRVA
ncbi:MAG: hypothetical protein DMD90_11310 [Candidatus Rokuibacteriota bacterium]|nr:MAG: hypothetical protein DMD90_11310 [Candidatus Rokubacteria bacterium]